MRKITIILSAILLLSSCKLDFYPKDSIGKDALTEDDVELLYTGLYCYAQYKPTFNGYFQNDMAGGDFRRNKTSGYQTPALWIKDCVFPTGGWLSGPWIGYYTWLHQVNSFIASASRLPASSKKNEMLGGAYFFRGLIYYNLVSKYRCVPILRVATSERVENASEEQGWAFVEENLELAIQLCPGFTDKNYVSRQAAKALMARVKIGQNKKEEAGALAEEVIKDPLFALADFDKIFRNIENSEEILTFSNLQEESGVNFCGQFYLPGGQYFPTQEMVDAFLPNDKRGPISLKQDGDEYVINKYSSQTSTDPIIVIRLAEMYLISAEAKGIAGGGLARLNQLRRFRGLDNVSVSTDDALVDAVLAERRLEFLAEGFRWFDLVRTGRYCSMVGLPEKYTIFPIPQSEIDLNGKLKQHEIWK